MATNEDPTELNPEKIDPTVERLPTVLILDISGSMDNETETPSGEMKPKIDQLNDGLQFFNGEVADKEHASKRVDVAVVAFDSNVTVEEDFTPANDWSAPTLSAGGRTHMGAAIERAIDVVEDRKSSYHQEGISYNRPLLWLLTDGKPTDMDQGDQQWTQLKQRLGEDTSNNHFEFFAMGVNGADMDALNDLVKDPTGRPALELQEGMFEEFFIFLSNSLETASNPDSGDSFQLDVDHLQNFAQVGE
jgi:uncharacterized protein YegL